MKKIKHLSIVIITLIMGSCGTDDLINPVPEPSITDHEEIWNYDLDYGTVADIIPAIDPNDNIYFSMSTESGSNIKTTALDSEGNELWTQEVPGYTCGQTVYANGKVIIYTENPVSLVCFNALDGQLVWSKNLTSEYDFAFLPAIAVNNDKVYVSAGTVMNSFLISYDLQGNLIWIKENDIYGTYFYLSVVDNHLIFMSDDNIYRYDDNTTTCDSVWALQFNTNKSDRLNSLDTRYSIPIGSDGNIYLRNALEIYKISINGELLATINLASGFDQSFSNITISENNDILISNLDLYKYSSDGNLVWQSNINDGLFINPSFSSAPIISSNGNYYDAQLFGLYSVNSDGNLAWKVNSENGGGTEFGNLHMPVLNHQGNIISVSTEQKKVRCFKGDGQGLSSDGWPKPYYDYGNTSSK